MQFSVIVCTYNYAHLLPDALRTLAAQTLSDFELLIADDGSSDRTEEVVAEFRPRFRDCRYLKKPHTGTADTRNVAVRAARGSHVAFLDSDDLWSRDYLRTIQDAFEKHPRAELVFSKDLIFYSEERVVTDGLLVRRLPALCGPIRDPRELFHFVNAFSPSGMAFSKSLYDRTGPFDVQFSEWVGYDLDWVMRALMAGAFCVCLKRKLYLTRVHSSNVTKQPAKFLRAWLRIYAQTLKESRNDPRVETAARRITREYALRLLGSSSPQEGRFLLRTALKALGGDPVLKLAYLSTFLGSAGLAKLARLARRLADRLWYERRKLDPGAHPETILDSLSQ